MAAAKKSSVEREEGAETSDKIGVSGPQVAGGALASVTAAFLGGQLGVAGTLWGAGLTSVVITVGGAVYQRSLEASREKAGLAAARAGLRGPTKRSCTQEAGGTGEGTTRHAPPGRSSAGSENPAAGRAPDSDPARTRRIRPAADSGMHWPGGERVLDQSGRSFEAETRVIGRPDPTGRTHFARASATTRSRKRIRWGMVAVTSAMTFGLGMLILTGFEGIVGKPVSGGQGGTTIGQLVPRPAETPAPPAEPETPPSGHPEQPGTPPSGRPEQPGRPQPDEPSSEPEIGQDGGTDSTPREPVPQPAETAPPAPEDPAPTREAPAGGAAPESAVPPRTGKTVENSEGGER